VYRVLYRQYRPQRFAELAGQKHVTDALSAELTGGRLAHAYLFTGSRGTGKTSCAKILSRAVNCENPLPNGDPCNECDCCRGILDGTILDVAEIDAASNNGVDNIRELKEEADFPPVRAKHRVYIIDEVHMLSIGAFNAFLKLLEEPPEHVIFILATTEVHKIPATILSRCQRFDFRRILPEEIAARLHEVAAAEKVSLTQEAALLIARIADGALRDALSLLDSAISAADGTGAGTTIDEETVSRAAGVADRSYLFTLTDCIAAKDTAGALRLLHTLYSGACDMERLCSELLFHFRHLMLTGTLKDARDLVVCTQGEYDEIKRQGELFPLPASIRAIRELEQTLNAMKYDSGKRLLMELVLIKLTQAEESAPPAAPKTSAPTQGKRAVKPADFTPSKPPAKDDGNDTPAAIESPPVEPEKDGAELDSLAPAADTAADEKAQSHDDEIAEKPVGPAEQEAAAPAVKPSAFTAPEDFWPQVLELVGQNNPALAPLLKGSSARIEGKTCFIQAAHPALPLLAATPINSACLESALEKVCGRAVKFNIDGDSAPPSAAEPDPLDELEENLFG
jgi:DNA polymerase-3 subunit gamma/tau